MELLVYCALLGSIIAGCMSVFLSANRMFALTALAQDRLVNLREVRQDFVDLVHEANGFRDTFGDHTAAPDTLILALPADDAGRPRTAVCTTANNENRLVMFEYAGDNMTSARWFAGEYDNVAFDTVRASGNKSPIANLRLQIRPEDGERRGDAVVHQFSAAPRGIAK